MAARRFMFEDAFDADEDIADEAPAEEAEAPPMFDEAALEATRKAAFEEGFAAGCAQATADAVEAAETRRANAGERIAAGAAALLAAGETAEAAALGAAALAASRAVQTAFPALAVTYGGSEILATVKEALERAADEPRLVVRLADADFETIEPELAGLAARSGYAGRIVTLEDATVADGDVRVEWADGGLARDLNRLTDAVARALAGLAANAAQSTIAAETPPASAEGG